MVSCSLSARLQPPPTETRRGGTRSRGSEPVSRLPAASAAVGNARIMAGLFLIGTPVLGGLVGGSILQVAMRTYGLSLFQRIGVEASLMGLGSIVIYLKPMGSAATGENWGTCVLALSVVTTGGFAMAEGLIINIVPGGGATVLKALGLSVAVAVAYQCYRRRERRLAEQGSPLH